MDYLDNLVKSRFIEIFGHIRTNSKRWRCNKLGDLGDFKTGGTPSSKHEEFYNGTIPFISTPSLGPNYIDETAAKYLITQEAIDSCATTLIPAGSLIIGTRINVGQSSINKIPLCTNQDIVSMMNVSENYDLLFLKHCIEQYVPYLDSQKKGATIKGITVDLLKSISIPEPPIDLQRQYVNFVQQVDKSKAIVQKCIDKYDQLVKSRFIEMFGNPLNQTSEYEYAPIMSFSKCVAGATPSTLIDEYWDDGTIPWLSSGEVNQGRIYSTEKKITQKGYDNCSTHIVPAHTVLIALAGQGKTRGTVAVTEIELCTNQSICSIITDKTIEADYLYHALKIQYDRIRSMSNGDGGRGGLNLKIVGKITVPKPPIVLQQQFAKFVQQVDKSKFNTYMLRQYSQVCS